MNMLAAGDREFLQICQFWELENLILKCDVRSKFL